jgi:hydroxyacylglutathione hydrolase
MKIHVLPVGMLQTNCYIVGTEQKNALVVDPGADARGIRQVLEENGLTLRIIAFTHGHYDHIGAANSLRDAAEAAYLPREDEALLQDPSMTGGGLFRTMEGYHPREGDIFYGEGDRIVLDEISLEAIHTPGHTEGSYLLLGEGVLFSGDTLFAGSCGRTDFFSGDSRKMQESMRRIAMLPGEYRVLPGHGPATELSVEKMTNPWLGTNYDDIF